MDTKHVTTVTVVTESQEEAQEVAEAIRLMLQARRLGCRVKVGPSAK